MRITESHLRRIIADEAKKFKRGKRIGESLGAGYSTLGGPGEDYEALTRLHSALEDFYQSLARDNGHDETLDYLQDVVTDWVSESR